MSRLRLTLTGWVKSPEGYRARFRGRSTLEYEDELGRLSISSELMAEPSNSLVIYVRSIPDEPARPRDLVVRRVVDAMAHVGLESVLADDGAAPTGGAVGGDPLP